MTPSQYESFVAEHFRFRGYVVRPTPASNDYGVDVFATKGVERIAVQAKMYGDSSRLVNRDVVLHLHGAKDFFDCTRAVIATDGGITEDAVAVAQKLGIELLFLQPTEAEASGTISSAAADKVAFDIIWEQHILPLTGLVMRNSRGDENTLRWVDWAGVERITSEGKSGFIPIDIFRKSVAELLAHGVVTRDKINEMYPQRASSGILLVLSQVPLFELLRSPLSLCLRPDALSELAKLGVMSSRRHGPQSKPLIRSAS